MNKLVIPIILVAIVAIAAGFAFSPVDQATSVHSSLLDAICVANGDYQTATGGGDEFWDGEACVNLDE